jgi:predicted transcriptional regulator
MSRPTLKVRIGGAAEALDRFEYAWNRAGAGAPPAPSAALAFADLRALLRALTPARWELLARLRAEEPLSILALARRLGRDYKNVHTDVTALLELGLLERRADGRVAVPWDAVRAELRLGEPRGHA